MLPEFVYQTAEGEGEQRLWPLPSVLEEVFGDIRRGITRLATSGRCGRLQKGTTPGETEATTLDPTWRIAAVSSSGS